MKHIIPRGNGFEYFINAFFRPNVAYIVILSHIVYIAVKNPRIVFFLKQYLLIFIPTWSSLYAKRPHLNSLIFTDFIDDLQALCVVNIHASAVTPFVALAISGTVI